MQKPLALLASMLVLAHVCLSQSITQNFSVYPVRTIQSADEDYSDLEFLKEVLKDKRIVLLGEQTHGDGATFEAKVRLVKFLHSEMGFDMLSFESDMFEGSQVWSLVSKMDYKNSPLYESIYSMWSDTKELEPLIQYVHQQTKTQSPLMVSGFDCQGGSFVRDNLLNEIKLICGSTLTLSEEENLSIDQVLSASVEFLVEKEADSILFFSTAEKISSALKKTVALTSNKQHAVVEQYFNSTVEMIKWYIDEFHERKVSVQNPRDLQMALNFIFLSKLYPDKKIIAWGASYHFADQIELLESTPLVKSFSAVMDSLQRSQEPTDVIKGLEGAVPMGKILKQHFGNTLYSLAFSSFDGSFGWVNEEPYSLQKLQPPPGSIELELITINKPVAFVNYSGNTNQKFYSSALGNLPIYAPWQHVFDGLFFIKTSYPPSLPGNLKIQNQVSTPKEVYLGKSNSVRVIDSKTNEPIAFVSVGLMGTAKGVITNSVGEFVLNVPEAKPSAQVLLSCIGYKSDTLTVGELSGRKTIMLEPQAQMLEAVEIRSKSLSAREIVKLAEKKISTNYYQGAYQQEVFYRVSDYKEDSLLFNEEASVLVHDVDGYNKSGKPLRNMKGEILQFRNTTGSKTKDLWEGVGSLWLMITHDPVMDKDNVLHRSVFYNLELLGITQFENKRVYEIAFDCKRPGAFTTGFGYPAPVSATGKVFIEVGTYAMLRFEAHIVRKPMHYKKSPHILRDPYGHHLIQTYKEVDGKLFLHYSRQVYYAKETNEKNNQTYRGLSIRELLSTEIDFKPTHIPANTLVNIKAAPVKEDLDFWKTHNVVVEDDVSALLKFMD